MTINRYHIIGLALYTALIVTLTYLLSRPNTSVNGLSTQDQKYVDSLNIRIGELEGQQKLSDSLIANYKKDIEVLDHKIDSTKNKVTQIRKEYEGKIKNIGRYTPTELDNFFTDRYK